MTTSSRHTPAQTVTPTWTHIMTQKPKQPLPKGFTAPNTSSSTATVTDYKAAYEELDSACTRYAQELAAAREEIARLTTALQVAQQNIENARRDEQRNCERLRAEIERLTEEEIPR